MDENVDHLEVRTMSFGSLDHLTHSGRPANVQKLECDKGSSVSARPDGSFVETQISA